MKEMYTEVYSHLAERGLAVKYSENVWRNAEGEIVKEEQAVGLKSEYELIHPELVVFVDEVGSNTRLTYVLLMAAHNNMLLPKTPISQCWALQLQQECF
jgi:hypothetical protein